MFDNYDLGSGFTDTGGSSVGSVDPWGGDYGNWAGDSLGAGIDTGGAYYGDGSGALSIPQLGSALGFAGASGNGGITDAAKNAGEGSSSTADNRSAVQKLLNLKTDKAGDTMWSDPKNLDKLIKLGLGVASLYGASRNATQNAAARSADTEAALKRQVANSWSPQQSQWSNSFFQSERPDKKYVYASERPSVIRSGVGYADGGGVPEMPAPSPSGGMGALTMLPQLYRSLGFQDEQNDEQLVGALMRAMGANQAQNVVTPAPAQQQPNPAMMPQQPIAPRRFAEGGDVMPQGDGALTQAGPFVGYVDSDTPGQTDLFDIKVAGGEYVLDAESVSMLGDGNNAAGAKYLDHWREELRRQKRAAPDGEVPPTMAELGEDEEMDMDDEEGGE